MGGVGLNFLELIRFKPCRVSWLLCLPYALAKRMPDKAFWTPRYRRAADELKPCLSGTDILLVLILMEVTLGQRSLRRAWGCEDAESKRGRKCPFAFLRRKTLPLLLWAYSLSRVQLFATPWPEARQAPQSMEILQARILESVAMIQP